MIAVAASESQHPVVREFFELFKTPWQFHRPGLECDVLVCSAQAVPQNSARLVLILGAKEQVLDRERGIRSLVRQAPTVLNWGADKIPIFTGCATFEGTSSDGLHEEENCAPATMEFQAGRQAYVRVGFDLFAEVEFLLTEGQPKMFARIPTLELHIAFLRELILRHEIPLWEIPPVPEGHEFIACLTHDVDHPRIRDHIADHTMFGFLYRALLGSWLEFANGRKRFAQVAANYRAALALPLVYLGMAKDFWNQFRRYREIEGDAKSTFFVIPEKGNPGLDANGRSQTKRAARYSLRDLARELGHLLADECEVATHGIDAWRDSSRGKNEQARIREISDAPETGVRMHWLFFDRNSPKRLEEAGFSYDSTVGYNDAVGYRAGTTQVFKPLGVEHLMELPMHLMDTAMFYPSYLDLPPDEARNEVRSLLINAARFGGVLTINWHDRSIAPERLWDGPYLELIEELRARGAWLPTASDAISWFRRRRGASMEVDQFDGTIRVSTAENGKAQPALRLRLHHPAARHNPGSSQSAFTDFTVAHSQEFHLDLNKLKASAA